MGKKQQWVSRRLIFGRFLVFTPTGVNAANLTERRFRDYWKRTSGKESERFAAVLSVLENGIPQGHASHGDSTATRDTQPGSP